MSLRTTILRLTILLCYWLRTHHSVFAANITVEDTDPSIVYSPQASWYPSSNLCSACLDSGFSTSYYEGIHPAPSFDPDDFVSTSSLSTPTPSSPVPLSSMPPPAQTPSPPNLAVVAGSLPTVSSSSSSPSTTHAIQGSPQDLSDKGKKGKKDLARQLVRPRLDIDDPGFVDIPVTFSYNFTGSAIYIFCIQPLGGAAVNGTPTNMNLSFIVDQQSSGSFSSAGTPGRTGFLPNQNVLSLNGLSNEPHQLVVNVGDNSVFLFDYLIYTDNSFENAASTTNLVTSMESSATQTTIKHVKRNNVGTFAGAVGGSVGVLSIFSLGIAISIIRRRMLAARRDRLDNEANATGNTPAMIGPMPFVPRYFPDTIIPPDPPTYNDALTSTNHNNAPLLASQSPDGYSSRQRSYADIPPALPPLTLEEIPPPPPFPLALSTHIPDLPPDVTLPSTQTSDSLDPVGNGLSDSTSSPENVPLLQSSDPDTRSRSRPPTSYLESPENSEANHHQEDAS